jgi:hypothetical protein
VINLLQETENISAFAAAKAVPHAPAWSDVKTWRPLVMKWAQTFERPATSRLQGDVFTNHIFDPGPLTDKCDVLVTNPASHEPILGALGDLN